MKDSKFGMGMKEARVGSPERRDRLLPLVERFAQLVREQSVFRDAFGLI